MSGQEVGPSSLLSTRTPWTERLLALEEQVNRIAHQMERFKTRTTGELERTEEEKWTVFEWMDEADAKFEELSAKDDEQHEDMKGKMNAIFVEARKMVDDLRSNVEVEQTNMKGRLDMRIKEHEEIIQNKVTDRDTLVKQLMTEIDKSKGKSIRDMKTFCESSVGELEAKIMSLLEDQEGKLGAMKSKVRDVESKVTRASSGPSASVHLPSVMPIVPPSPPVARHVSSVKWSKNLSKLRHKEVRNFVSLFKSFMNASGMTEEELKLTLLQSLEGEVMQLVAPIADSSSTDEILERLLNRVRPSQSVLMRKLMETKQRMRESVYDFGARFLQISSDLPTYSDSRIRDILIESLNETWKMTARSLVMSNSHLSVEELLHKLMELEGTDAADRMEIDHVMMPKRPQYEEYREPREVWHVVMDGRINWDEVRDARTLSFAFKQLARVDRAFRNDMLNWLHQRPPRPNMQRNGYRPPPNNRPRQSPPNRRIFNVNEQPEPEHECEVCEDELFEEQEQACCTAQIVQKRPIKVIHRSSSVPVKRKSHSSSKRTPQKSYLAAATSGLKNPPLMFLRTRLNGNACDALIDTGSQISIIPYNKTTKWGISFDKNRKQVLCGFDGNESESAGVATIDVTIGNETFKHDFVVVSAPKAKLIFGNDIMKAQELLIDPASHQIQLKDDRVVPCHQVDSLTNATQPSTSAPRWTIKAVEPLLVEPVVKDEVVLIPAGKSFALGAKTSKTMILPLTTSDSVQVLDANRLPPGIITSAGVWMRDQRLRVTVSNTTSRSVMIGSKAAIAGVMTFNDRPPQIVNQSGKDKELKRV